jgi:hypothetical protein
LAEISASKPTKLSSDILKHSKIPPLTSKFKIFSEIWVETSSKSFYIKVAKLLNPESRKSFLPISVICRGIFWLKQQ